MARGTGMGGAGLEGAKHELAERHQGAALELARRADGSGKQLAIEIAQCLAELYDATGRAEQALELRAQRR